MKKNIFFIMAIICYGIGFSQNFNYQAVVRDASNNLVLNQAIGVQISIRKGVAPDQLIYTETQLTTTNAYGLLNVTIGTGTVVTGDFTTINWSSQDYWLEIALDITGGTTYVVIGTTKLQSVPYANYAMQSGDKALSTTANVTSNAPGDITEDSFVFGSTQLDNDTSTSLDDHRMFFNKTKGAFRAGGTRVIQAKNSNNNVDDTWDDVNVGTYSFAAGNTTVSSGYVSTAFGSSSTASGTYSFASGDRTLASEASATAMGALTKAVGKSSSAFGVETKADSYAQTSIGLYNTELTGNTGVYVPTDRLFVIGNGMDDSNKSDALVMLKNGNTTLNGTLTIDGDNQGAEMGYTLPAQDGTNNQIMSTDGAGNVVWVTPSANEIPTGGNNGQILSTDGTGNYTWIDDDVNDADADPTNEIELPAQTGHANKLLSTDGTTPSWTSDLSTNSVTTDALTVRDLPAFSADLNGTKVMDAVGDIKLQGWRTFDDALEESLFNNGSDFNEITGEFTAPVSGFYYFSAQVRFDGITTGWYRLQLVVNEAPSLNNGLHAIGDGESGNRFHSLSIGGVLKLDASDKVSVYVHSANDADWNINDESGFNGYLISRF